MALQVWLPLDGDLRNQGLGIVNQTSNATVSYYNNGKIGKAYNLNVRTTFTCENLNGLSSFSICFWAKTLPSSTLTTDWQDIIGFNDVNSSGAVGQFRFETGYKTAGAGIHWHNNETYALVHNSATYFTERNVWHHCVFTIEKGVAAKSYVDGVLFNTQTTNLGGGYLNGKFWIGETNNIEGALNDVRIYDHVLSYKEVKELSKGLILHYRLSKPMPNLLKGNTTANKIGSYPEEQEITFSGWDIYGDSNVDLTATELNSLVGKTITYSCYLNNVSQTTGTGTGIMLHINYADGTYQQFGGGKNGLLNSWLAQGESGLCWLTITIPDPTIRTNPTTISRLQYSIRHNSRDGVSTVKYKLAKVEIGSQITTWIPNESDALYSAMGYDSNIELDCAPAGNQNDGTIVGTITAAADSSRYSTSYYFPSGANYINAGTGAKVTDAITINLWAKYTTWGNLISCTEGGGWNVEEGNGGIRFPVYTTDNAYKVAQTTVTSTSLKDNKWHMFTGTYNGMVVKMYIDGEEKGSLTASSAHKDIKYVGNAIFIGAEAAGNTTTPASTAFVGNISDVRIYCTALSASDIAELYHTAAQIDKDGNTYAYEFKEA